MNAITCYRQKETAMKFRRAIGALACLALVAAGVRPAGAYTYLETTYGTPQIGLSARGIGMGGAMIALPDGSFSLVQNPAMMSSEAMRVADLSMRAVRYDESRFVPLFDTFDSWVKETAVAENQTTYTGLNGGLLWRPAGNTSGLALGGGFFERYNMQFNFVDERRKPTGGSTGDAARDRIQGIQTISSGHSIYSLSAGASYKERVLSFGTALHYYFGDITWSNATEPGPGPASSGLVLESAKSNALQREVQGIGATFGIAAEAGERVTLAAAYEMPVTLDIDWHRTTLTTAAGGTLVTTDSTGAADMIYPGRLTVGLAYRPRNPLRTTFTLNVTRTYWAQMEESLFAAKTGVRLPGLRSTYEYRFGLEHVFYDDLPAWFGFFYRQGYASDQTDDAGISAGTAYRFNKFDVGIAADVFKRNSRQKAITPRDTTRDPTVDRVQDSLLRGVLDVRYHF